jgi:putative acetyltransferase
MDRKNRKTNFLKNKNNFIIKEYKSSDCNQIITLFNETVHTINAKDYTSEQLKVWATGKENFDKWNTSLLENYTLVAFLDDKIVGFGDIDNTGYLDKLYVHKDYQNNGIATEICNKLEQKVQGKIIVHASITAKSFFEQRNYKVIKKQNVIRENVMLINFIMEKNE